MVQPRSGGERPASHARPGREIRAGD